MGSSPCLNVSTIVQEKSRGDTLAPLCNDGLCFPWLVVLRELWSLMRLFSDFYTQKLLICLTQTLESLDFCPILYPQHLERWHSVSACMNEWMSGIRQGVKNNRTSPLPVSKTTGLFSLPSRHTELKL